MNSIDNDINFILEGKSSNDNDTNEQNNNKQVDNKNKNSEKLIKDIMILEPSAALKFVAQQFDSLDPKTFLLRNLLPFSIYAVKHGLIKMKDIGMSVKDFTKKNKDDATDIDFSNVEIDEGTMKKVYVIDDNVLKKLEDFIKEYKALAKESEAEIENASKELSKDIKRSGIALEDEDLADNSLTVAGVIRNPKNKKLPKNDLTEKVKQAVSKKNSVKKMKTAVKKAAKSEQAVKKAKTKAGQKYKSISTEEAKKIDAQIQKKVRVRSEQSKKNDAFRAKLKRAVQRGVSSEFKDSVKVGFLSNENFKKVLQRNLKAGLKAEDIKDDRVICIATKCLKKDFSKVLSEDAQFKIIDISNGSKSEEVQRIVDYIESKVKDFVPNGIGQFYAYRKQSTDKAEPDVLYVFAGVKQESLNEATLRAFSLNEAAGSTDEMPIEDLMSHVKVDGDSISHFFGAGIPTSILKSLKVEDPKDLIMSLASEKSNYKDAYKSLEHLLGKFLITQNENGTEKAVDELLKAAGNNEYKKYVFSELAAKMFPDAEEQFAKHGITITKNLAGLDDGIDNLIDNISDAPKVVANKVSEELATASKNSYDISDKVEKAIKHGNFNASRALTDAQKSLGLSDNDLEELFARNASSSASRNIALRKVENEIKAFMSMYDKDPEAAVKSIVKTSTVTPQKEALAEIMCKLKPDAAKYFEKHGYSIDGKIAGISSDITSQAVDSTADASTEISDQNFLEIGKGARAITGGTSLVDSQAVTNAAYSFGKKYSDPNEAMEAFKQWCKDGLDKDSFTCPGAMMNAVDDPSNPINEYARKIIEDPDGFLKKTGGVSKFVLDNLGSNENFFVHYSLYGSSGPNGMQDYNHLIRALYRLNPNDEQSIAKAKSIIEGYKTYAEQFPESQGDFHKKALQIAASMFRKQTGQAISGIDISDSIERQVQHYSGSAKDLANNMKKVITDYGIAHKLDTASAAASSSYDAGMAGIEDADDAYGIRTIPNGFIKLDSGQILPSLDYASMNDSIDAVDSMLEDGVIDESEIAKICQLQDQLYKYSDWANMNLDVEDPTTRSKAAIILQLIDRINDKVDKCDQVIEQAEGMTELADDEAAAVAASSPDVADSSKQAVSLADNEEAKEATSGFLGKFGKALRSFGQALAIAKIAKFTLNGSKAFIDACGGMAVKFKENSDAIAEITVLVSNGDDSMQKFSDTRFGIYFSADDLKWHATNLDDRKMKIDNEDKLIDKVLNTSTGKDFKKEFITRLDRVFDGENGKALKFITMHAEELGVKIPDKNISKLLDKMKNVIENFDEVKKQFS